jgi:hypothetical protein
MECYDLRCLVEGMVDPANPGLKSFAGVTLCIKKENMFANHPEGEGWVGVIYRPKFRHFFDLRIDYRRGLKDVCAIQRDSTRRCDCRLLLSRRAKPLSLKCPKFHLSDCNSKRESVDILRVGGDSGNSLFDILQT